MNKWQHQLIFTEWWTWPLQSMVINDKWVLGQEDSLWVRTPTYLVVYLTYCKHLNSPPMYLILQECIWTTRNRHFTRGYTFYRHPAWTSHVCIDCLLRNMYWFAYNYYETLLRASNILIIHWCKIWHQMGWHWKRWMLRVKAFEIVQQSIGS